MKTASGSFTEAPGSEAGEASGGFNPLGAEANHPL